MKPLHYTIKIQAPVEKVWHAMLDDATYREWTAVFDPSSRFIGTWEKGSKMLFVGGEKGDMGMVSYIEEVRPHEFVSIKHVGMLKDGVEDTTSEDAKKWAPAYENYTFKVMGSETEVVVDVDMDEKYAEEFDRMWPAALQKLKEIAER